MLIFRESVLDTGQFALGGAGVCSIKQHSPPSLCWSAAIRFAGMVQHAFMILSYFSD